MKLLLPFQVEAIDHIVSRRHTLLADEPGLGKTVQSIGVINRLQSKKNLIVCPASVKINWKKELKEWLDRKLHIQIVNKKSDELDPFVEIIIINYDLINHSYLFNQLKQIKFTMGFFDEAHYLKSMCAQRTASVLAKNGLVRNCERTLMITGTPVLNRPVELFPILKVLSPETIAPYNSYDSYARRFCDAWQDGFALNVSGASHTDDLNKRLRGGYMIRRTFKEVGYQLPPLTTQIFMIKQTKTVKIKLEQLDNATKKNFKFQTFEEQDDHIATLRQETAGEKIGVCLEYLRDYVTQVGKLVVFAYHHSIIKKLQETLEEFNPVTLMGSTTQPKRQQAIEIFQRDPNCHVFIGQIQAAGEGVDGLQNVCSNMIFIETDWVPARIQQCIGRLKRMGQTKPMVVKFLIWEGSVEEHMMRVALEKIDTIREILR